MTPMRKIWLIGLGTAAVILFAHLLFAANSPLISDTKVDGNTITIGVAYESNDKNEDVTVAVTALDSIPAEWASATVYHVWYITPRAMTFDDVWPNMRTGHFRVQVTLHRDNKAIDGTPVTVEVK
jgi:hypothetical protein